MLVFNACCVYAMLCFLYYVFMLLLLCLSVYMLRYVMLRYVMLCYVMLCSVMLTVPSSSAGTLHATKPVSLVKTNDVHLHRSLLKMPTISVPF